MKVKTTQHGLHMALTAVQRVVIGKPQLPILAMVKLVATRGLLTLYATDLIAGIKIELLAEVDQEGECVVPAKPLFAFISSLSQTDITLEFSQNTLRVLTSDITSSMQTGNATDFPEFPNTSGKKAELRVDNIRQITRLMTISAAKDQVRPVLSSIYFTSQENGCEIVCTDGFRLSILTIAQLRLPIKTVLLPAKSLLEIEKIAQATETDVVELQFSEEQQTVVCTIGNNVFFSRLVAGEFPPYAKIVPADFATSIQLQRQNLEENVKRSMIFAQQDAAFVQLTFDKNKAELTSKNSAGETMAASLIAQDFVGEAAEISFNSRYLLDYLRVIDDEFVVFSMNESLRPAQFTSAAEPNFRYIVMPFRVR